MRLFKYLYSAKNMVGCVLALTGVVLHFIGVIGPLWPVIVAGLYLIGVLVAPGTKSVNLRSGFDPSDVRKALEREVFMVSGQLPPDVMAKVQSIQQIILGILPRSGVLPADSPELYIVQRTATEYLPTARATYLNLPRAYATLHPVQQGKTSKQILLDQLGLLENKMSEVADDVHRYDADRLLANGRFLEERFGRSALSLEGPATSSQ